MSKRRSSVSTNTEAATSQQRSVWSLLQPKDSVVLATECALAAVVFSTGMSGQLVFDDHLALTKNPDSAANGTALSDVFRHDFWGHDLNHIASNASYRPLCILTFRIQHWLMGYRHVPWFLHAFNYIFATMNAMLIYFVTRIYNRFIFDDAKSEDGAAGNSMQDLYTYGPPGLAMLLFTAHPVHVDSVTSIVGRCELLSFFFGLLAFLCVHFYLMPVRKQRSTCSTHAASAASRCGTTQKGQSHQPWYTRIPRALFLSLMFVLMAVGVLCKDSGVTFAGIFSCHAGVMLWMRLCTRRQTATVVAASVMFVLSYFLFRASHLGLVDLAKSPLLRRTENPQYFTPPGRWSWLAMLWVIQMKNAELLFWPTRLCCEYSYNCIPFLESLSDPRVPYFAVATAVFFVVFATTVYYVVRHRSRRALVLLMAMLWLAIPYAPVSHLIVRVGTFIAERCLYAPSVGAVLLYVFGLFIAISSQPRVAVALLLALVLWWSAISFQRSNEWHDDTTLFRAAIEVCPTSGKSYYQLATSMVMKQRNITEEMAEIFEKGYSLDPDFKDPLYYLATYELQRRNTRRAFKLIRECAADAFSMTLCFPAMESLRAGIFANMTTHEQLLDNAEVVPSSAIKALFTRTAALVLLQDRKPCEAYPYLRKALSFWEKSGTYWLSDDSNRIVGSDNYCNTLYHTASAFRECHLASASPVESKGDEEATALQPITDADTEDLLLQLLDGAKRCSTDWGARATLKAKPHISATYPIRMRDYVSLVRLLGYFASEVEPLQRSQEARDIARAAHFELLLRQYCSIVDIVEHAAALRSSFPHLLDREISNVQNAFASHQTEMNADILHAAKGIGEKPLTAGNLTEARKLLHCSPGLDGANF